jgi:lactate permease
VLVFAIRLALFVLLAGVRMAAQWACLIILATALIVVVVVCGMPIDLALDSTLLGVAFGLFPIVGRESWLRSSWIHPTSTCRVLSRRRL